MSDTDGLAYGSAKTIVITVATACVGRGLAIACGELGWSVWIAARRAEQGNRVAAEVSAARGISCSVMLARQWLLSVLYKV